MTIGFKANNDGSAAIQVGGTDRVTLSSAGVMEVPAGIVANLTGAADKLSTASGSAPSYAARAWVNFNGTGTVAIRAAGNVSSITDNGTGDYTVNFTTAMADANYAVNASSPAASGAAVTIYPFTQNNGSGSFLPVSPTTSLFRLSTAVSGSYADIPTALVSVFR